jgi:tetratricopeptide (TPR) repeat protein
MKHSVWLLTLCLVTPAEADQKKPSQEDLLQQGEQKQTAGDLDGAAEVYKQAAGLPGATAEPSLRLGRVLEAKGELDTAIDAYKTASEKATGASKGEALGRLALVEETRSTGDVSALVQGAVAADPGGLWPTIAQARARAREGKGDEALSLAQKAKAAGGGAAASAALAYAQEARGDLGAAEAAYREALAADSAPILGSVGLARVLRKTGRASEGLGLVQKVLEKAPGAVDAYKESARDKIALNRAGDANGDAVTAASLAEGDQEAQSLLKEVTVAKAMDELKRNEADLALQELTALRDKDPGFAEGHVGLARVLMAKRQLDPATVELRKAIELKPDLAEAHYQLAYLSYSLKQNPLEALPEYQKAVSLDPGNLDYRTNLGVVLTAVKQFDPAVAELTKVIESPGYNRADGLTYLGAALVGAKRYKDAIAPLEKAASIAPTSPEPEAYLAWCYFGLKDAENFKKHGGKARTLGHKEPTLLQYLARVEKGEAIK